MTVHSKDSKPWKTKLDRISELSAENREMVFNNLGHHITEDMLKDLYSQLEANRAVGIDDVTKEQYGYQLEENIKAVIRRIRKGTYRPKAIRIVEIPKEDGDTRPLAISCFEDKLVQLAISKILSAIYEPLFLPSSYGFRPNRSCHDALRALNYHTYRNGDGACIEIDIRKCFNTIPHDILKSFLTNKISDKRFVKLITVMMQPLVIQGGRTVKSHQGCPQGSIVSPVLSNIFLHHVIDEWFESLKETHIKGYTAQVRYCDDMVFIFANRLEAEKFYRVLPKRLNKYGLELKMDKSNLIPSGRYAAKRADLEGKRLPTYKFLGFTCYWGKSKKGHWRLKYTSRSDRFRAKLKNIKSYLRKNLNAKDTIAILRNVVSIVKGWINYHAVSDNNRRVSAFIHLSKHVIHAWFLRRGRKHPPNWKKLTLLLKSIGFPTQSKVVPMF